MGVYTVTISGTGEEPVHSYMVDAGNEQVAITRALQKDRRKMNHPHVWMIACGKMKGTREKHGMALKEVRTLSTTHDHTARLRERGDIKEMR